ncbi:hypothetical protein SAMD00019534_109690 [Acytostelium subglobosum LB1]|uniref:hypothetical protein n=1 Tax=Acytostelium subglobosum LB1 TaxID=1410327 RepID=UPI000644EA21|nr:hypothetical protein SAMD00019534_109690 [Acytostelium subglobosum LB1]GAM27793.1 hypothetical protein SAMD00019534_109690 [Acytostelium subglobosum LB1]|eukprot:XP_012749452.1 hypothetical protein SAMD00019534_109690 [Acytostelium subglobosum LB1]
MIQTQEIDFKNQLADRLKKRSSAESQMVLPPQQNAPHQQQSTTTITNTSDNNNNTINNINNMTPPISPRHKEPKDNHNSRPPIPDRRNIPTHKSSSSFIGSTPAGGAPPKIGSFAPPPPPPASLSMGSLAPLPQTQPQQQTQSHPHPQRNAPPPPPPSSNKPSTFTNANLSAPLPPMQPGHSPRQLSSGNLPLPPTTTSSHRSISPSTTIAPPPSIPPPPPPHFSSAPTTPLAGLSPTLSTNSSPPAPPPKSLFLISNLPLPPPPEAATPAPRPTALPPPPVTAPVAHNPPPHILPRPVATSSPNFGTMVTPIVHTPPPQTSSAPTTPALPPSIKPRPMVHGHNRSSSLDPKLMATVQMIHANPIPGVGASTLSTPPTNASQANHAHRLSSESNKAVNTSMGRLPLGMLSSQAASPPSAKSPAPAANEDGNKSPHKDEDKELKKKEKKEQKEIKKEEKEKEKEMKKEKKEMLKKEKKDSKKDKREIGSSSSQSSPRSAIFNCTLEQIMELQREKLMDQGGDMDVPVVLKMMTEAIIAMDGCSTEGIFRVPGTASEVQRFKSRFNELDFTLDTKDVHVVAGLLKLWLRELTDPIIPTSLYDECIKTWNQKNDSIRLIDALPTPNKQVMTFLLHFLKTVANPANIAKSKMDIDNIAMVFAPGLLRCPSTDPNSILVNSQYEKEFIRNLIETI